MPIATPQGTLDFKSVDTITFVGASSNTVIDTTTGSLGVGVDVNGPTSNLHVVGHTRLEGDINMLHTSNTASIKLNSNVVTEFPRSKKLIKYPRVAMTADNQPTGYVASASSINPNTDPYKAFDNVLYSSFHEPVYQPSPYPNTDGAYTGGSGTVYDTNGYQGEYLQIQLPEKIKLYNYSISNRAAAGLEGRQPKDAKIFASNDGNTWIDIHTHSDGGGTYDIAGETRSFQLDNITETHYKYYRLVINSIIQGGTNDTANISQWKLFGTPEYDPEADGVDVTIKSYPNVPNTDWLEVYYEGKNYTNGNSVQDETDNNIDGSFTGITYNTEYNSFDFSGVTDSSKITATLPSTFAGNQPFTVSVWFKRYNDLVTENTIWRIGPRTDEKCLGLAVSGGNFNFFGNDSTDGSFSSTTFNGGGYVVGRWYHVACVYDGSSRYIFIDSVRDGTTVTNSLDFNASTELVLGFNGVDKYLNGSIANFRLFNRALTQDEIYQLYAYQKEYFGHGDLSMTLKAGRLGIGTSEPRVALDVRGDVHISGSLRKTRARMIRLESGAKHFTLDGWQTYVSYGEAWTAYSSDPLYSISITGDYVEGGRAINYRIAVQNQRTDEVLYFPSSSGWIKYHYVDNTRLDGHGYLGIMSGLTVGDSYKVQLEVDPNSTNDYQWNAGYGTITGLVWD